MHTIDIPRVGYESVVLGQPDTYSFENMLRSVALYPYRDSVYERRYTFKWAEGDITGSKP